MNKLLLKVFIISQLSLFSLVSIGVFADPPGPPTPGGNPIGNGDPVGAPIENGVFILILMGIAYGSFKLYRSRKKTIIAQEGKTMG
jgi:hypothetical protein